jgi:GNAT superfamily N-acetyltransferase
VVALTPRTLEILALAVRRPLRNLGYGAEAVEELEQQEPAGAYLAAVPRTNGLAIYFWLRVGYRPLRVEEDRERARDPATLWMHRASGQGSVASEERVI